MKVTRNQSMRVQLQAAMDEMRTKQVRVGWFDTAKYEDGTPVAYVATVQEFGSPKQNIPARPFMRPTVAENKQGWIKQLGQGGKLVFAGKLQYSQMIGQFGMQAAGQVAETIASVTTPALGASTLRARASRNASGQASNKPLVDTGLLIQSVSSQVENV